MSITQKSIFAMSVLLLPVVAVAQNILVYYGEGGLNEGYSDFGDATGNTALSYAQQSRSKRMIKMLEEAGATH